MGSKPGAADPVSPDRGIVLTRTYAAPREAVFAAWTRPEILRRWGCTTPHVTVDLRPGGRFHFCMRTSEGRDFWGLGVYREVVVPERIVYLDTFSDAEGNVVSPEAYGMSPVHPMESLVEIDFEEEGAGTRVTLRHSIPSPVPERKDTREGWTQMLDRLAAVVAGD